MKKLKKLNLDIVSNLKTMEKEKMRSVIGGYGIYTATTIPTVYPTGNHVDDSNDHL